MKLLDARTLGIEGIARAVDRPPSDVPAEVARAVESIVADVRARGDAALLDYTARFDGFRPAAAAGLAIAPAELETGERDVEPAVRAAELVAATAGEPADGLSPGDREWAEQHGIPPSELVELACRAMKCVAALSDEWHERLNDLRYRLGDVAAA